MKTVILSVFALLFAVTGMSQTTGTDSSVNTQNSSMQHSTMAQTQHRKHPRNSMSNHRNHNMKSSTTRSSSSSTYNSSDSAMGNGRVRNGRRSGNKSNAYGSRSRAARSADSTHQ